MKQFSKELGKVSVTPKGVWDINTTSERLDIVYDKRNNQAYIAKQNVPVGVDIDNREYWQPMNVTGYADNNFINLTTENENGTITAFDSIEEAVATIFPINRRAGATLSFFNLNTDRLDRQAEFELWQFNSTDLANWENKDYWNNIYYNWNVFVGWYIGVDALNNHVKLPTVGQYAYVGSNLNDALLYQCRTNGTWTNTGIKVRNYISVVVSGNITIGENGNWFSDGKDTGIPATPAVDEQLDDIIIQLQQHTTEISNLKKSDVNLQDQITSNDSDITSLTAKHESLSKTVQGIAATSGASTATNVTYNNNASGLNAENAQDAIDELQSSKFDKTSILQESGEAEDKVMSQKAVSTKLSDLSSNLISTNEGLEKASTNQNLYSDATPVVLVTAFMHYYIDKEGKFVSYNYYAVYKPIKLKKDEVINVECSATDISVMSICDTDSITLDSTLTPVVYALGDTHKSYTYKATKDCYIVISSLIGANAQKSSHGAKKTLRAAYSELDGKIDEINSDLATKFDKENIAQKIGEAEDKVMSQKAVSEIVVKKDVFATGGKINTGMFFDVSTLGTTLALNFNTDKENYRIWLGFTNDSETDPSQYISGFAGNTISSVNININIINKNNAKYLYAYVSQPDGVLPSECKYTLTIYRYLSINDLDAKNIPFSSDVLDLKDSNIANAIEKTYVTKLTSDNINITYTRRGVYINPEGTLQNYKDYGISPVLKIKKGDIISGKIYAYDVAILAETDTDEYSETFNSLLVVRTNYVDNGYDFTYTAKKDMKIVFCGNMTKSSYYKIESIEAIPDFVKKLNSDIYKSNVQIDNIKNRVEVLEQKNESVESRFETLEQKNESVAQLNISSTALLATLCYGYNSSSNTRKKKYLCLSHITDVHGDHIRYKRWLDFTQDRKLIDGGFCTGDTNISTYNDNGFEACHSNQLSGITKPILVTIGNHDMGFKTNLYNNSNDNVGARFITPFISQIGAVQGGINKGYYYKDFYTYNIRVITLNEYEMPRVLNDDGSAYKYDLWGRYLSQEQADWLCNALSSLEEGWSVILLTHQMLDGYTKADNVFNSENLNTNDEGEHYVCQNGWIIQDILTAWLNRSSINKTYTPIKVSNEITGVEISDDNVPSVTVIKDFSASVGEFICAFSGHTHKDGNGKSAINRNLTIITLTDSNGKDIFRYDDLYRNENDKSQDCFNVYGFDTDNRLIKIVRFGADMNNDFVERKYLKISY